MQRLKRLLLTLINKKDNTLRVFIHIPKTAGTSFRASLEKNEDVVRDYGSGNEHTSDLVNEHVYGSNNLYALKESLSNRNTWLCGHMHLIKYLGIAEPQNMVTFVRDPVERVISHFNHEARWVNSELTIESFLNSHSAKNSQHRFLNGLPISLIGFVGITEQYSQSLALLDSQMAIKVEEAKFNENDKKVSNVGDLDEATLARIKEQNTLDQQLYTSAINLLAEREALEREQKAWTYIYATVSKDRKLRGIAYRTKASNPVELEVAVNGKAYRDVIASELTPLFPSVRFPRERFVGFSVSLHKHQNIENIVLTVKDTGQSYNVEI